MSASSFSARSFIYDHKGALVVSSLPWERVCEDLILTYSSNGIAGSDKLMMVVVYQRLSFTVQLSDLYKHATKRIRKHKSEHGNSTFRHLE